MPPDAHLLAGEQVICGKNPGLTARRNSSTRNSLPARAAHPALPAAGRDPCAATWEKLTLSSASPSSQSGPAPRIRRSTGEPACRASRSGRHAEGEKPRLVRTDTASPYYTGLADVLTKAFGVSAVLTEVLQPGTGMPEGWRLPINALVTSWPKIARNAEKHKDAFLGRLCRSVQPPLSRRAIARQMRVKFHSRCRPIGMSRRVRGTVYKAAALPTELRRQGASARESNSALTCSSRVCSGLPRWNCACAECARSRQRVGGRTPGLPTGHRSGPAAVVGERLAGHPRADPRRTGPGGRPETP
jgi:hypothetical protein